MSKRIIGLITATTIGILTAIAAVIDNHHHDALASNIVQQSAPPQLIKDAVIYAKDMIATCTPYSQHLNDNVTVGKTGGTDTCYNSLASVVSQCNPDSGMISGNAICSDPQLLDFQNNYYDADNRPYLPFQGIQSMINHDRLAGIK